MSRFVKFVCVVLIALLVSAAIRQSVNHVSQTVFASDVELKVGSEVPDYIFEIPEHVLAVKTIGDVSEEALKKYETASDYIYARRADSITGKGFEAFYSIDFNNQNVKYFLIPTAALGMPTAPADLALVNRETKKIEELFQCKIGYTAANKAAVDPKYKDSVILIPIDVVSKVERNFVESGKISDSVKGFQTAECRDYERRSLDFVVDRFNQLKYFYNNEEKLNSEVQ